MNTFDEIISPLLNDLESDLEEPIYGIRVLLVNNTGTHKSILLPWLTRDNGKATNKRHEVVNTDNGAHYLRAYLNLTYPGQHWLPTAARVVRLAEIPF